MISGRNFSACPRSPQAAVAPPRRVAQGPARPSRLEERRNMRKCAPNPVPAISGPPKGSEMIATGQGPPQRSAGGPLPWVEPNHPPFPFFPNLVFPGSRLKKAKLGWLCQHATVVRRLVSERLGTGEGSRLTQAIGRINNGVEAGPERPTQQLEQAYGEAVPTEIKQRSEFRDSPLRLHGKIC